MKIQFLKGLSSLCLSLFKDALVLERFLWLLVSLVHLKWNPSQLTRAGISVHVIHGSTSKGDATKWAEISSLGRALHWKGPSAATRPEYQTEPGLHAHGGCWLPAKTQAGALLCQKSVNTSLHPLDSVAHLQKSDVDYLLCKVLWDLLGISAFKRGVLPFLSKALFLPLHHSVAASEGKQEMMVILQLET